jgi:hypothetical protein
MNDFFRACAAALGTFTAVVVLLEFVFPGFASPLVNLPALVATSMFAVMAAVGRGTGRAAFWGPFVLVQGAAAVGAFLFFLSFDAWDAFAVLVAAGAASAFVALDLWWILRSRRLRAAEAAATLDVYDRVSLL